MKHSTLWSLGIVVIIVSIVVSCGNNNTSFPPSIFSGQWAWISGADYESESGIYGSKGVSAATNVPGARSGSSSWIDGSGKLWLFGGLGYDSLGNWGELNDLWKFDPSNGTWTWISGSNVKDQKGIYGIKGTADFGNNPGARSHAVAWLDGNNNIWLFGGGGLDSAGSIGGLNDLWMYNPSSGNWTWVSGSDTINHQSFYGTKGVASPVNIPGERVSAVSWIDKSGNLWLFGGLGLDSVGVDGHLNDLWRYDPASGNWTWMSGDIIVERSGVYGTKGVSTSSNKPGSRSFLASWVDGSGQLWLFGGDGIDSAGSQGMLNDLWKYEPSSGNWTWMSGANTVNQSGIYGMKGVTDSSNIPGARECAATWVDGNGNLWLFGEWGYDSAGNGGYLNDLWKYDPSNGKWSWMSGDNIIDQKGIYGRRGYSTPTNVPGGRKGAVTWTDKTGKLWLFGGYEYVGDFNDLFQYYP